MKAFKTGQRVRVSHCSGIDSGKTGVVMPNAIHSRVHDGSYTNFNAYREHVVRLDDGQLIRMFRNRLQVVGEEESEMERARR